MKTFQWTMQDELGLHARVAGELVKCVSQLSSKVTREEGGKTADATRLFAVMALCVRQGEVVTVTVEGPDEERDCAVVQDFCSHNF